MIVLGINSFFEHPSAAIIVDGELAFAVEDERFTRIKHGRKYTPYKTYIPWDSIHAGLKFLGLKSGDIDEIAYSYDHRHHLRSIWGCFTGKRLSSFREELTAYRAAVNTKAAIRSGYEVPERYKDVIDVEGLKRIPFRVWDHHLSHAASAYFCSGFESSLIAVADGSGENSTTSFYLGKQSELKKIGEMNLPDSLGFFYSFITKHLGFEPFSDEYKVMGLAAYGKPTFKSEMEALLPSQPNGKYKLDMNRLANLKDYFREQRKSDSELEQVHFDIACSAQWRLETVISEMVSYYLNKTGENKLCLAGGTFLNCLANARLYELSEIEDIFVQPAAHDAGTAIGCAALCWIKNGGAPQLRYDSMFLGTSYSDQSIKSVLSNAGLDYRFLDGREKVETLVNLLREDKIIGVFRGRMEFGPRALGNRSIIASPKSESMLRKINEIKKREQFRPVAPIVAADSFDDFFEGCSSRYMTFTVKVKDQVRHKIPAVVHVDGSARAQIVSERDDPFLYSVLKSFGEKTGTPVLVNTSLNVLGRPIDESPADAIASLFVSGLDYLLIENYLVSRN